MVIPIKKLIKLLGKIKNDEKGEFYIQIYAISLVVICIILSLINIAPAFIKQMNLNYVTERVVRDVEYTGEINSDTYKLLNDLAEECDITPTYSWSGDISARNRIQLRHQFTLTLQDEYVIELIDPSFADPICITLPLHKTLKGESQTYWKPGTE